VSPRQHAAHILSLRTRSERQAALAEVPEEWRELIKTHVRNAWHHPRGNKQ